MNKNIDLQVQTLALLAQGEGIMNVSLTACCSPSPLHYGILIVG